MEPMPLLMCRRYGFADLSRSGVKASVMRAGPMTLAAKVCSSASLRGLSWTKTPALFISTSRRPWSLSIFWAAAAMDFSSVTSRIMVEIAPLMPAAWISLLAALPLSGDRLARMTWYFSEAVARTFTVA